MENNNVIKEAVFNINFKSYIFFIVLFFLFASIVGIILVPFWVLGLGQWLSGKYFKTLRCSLTEKHLLFSKGMVFRIEKTIPLENIQDLSFYGGPFLRSMGLTFIKVETAGGGGAGHQNMMSIPGVEHAEELKAMILEQREKVIHDKHSLRGGNAASDTELLREIRDELKHIKIALEKNK